MAMVKLSCTTSRMPLIFGSIHFTKPQGEARLLLDTIFHVALEMKIHVDDKEDQRVHVLIGCEANIPSVDLMNKIEEEGQQDVGT